MPYAELTAEGLVALVAIGQKEAMEEVYARYARPIYSLALHMLHSREAAEEVVQDTFLALWQKASSYRQERGSVGAWLMTIAHHRAVDRLRRDRRGRVPSGDLLSLVEPGLGFPDPAQAATQNEERHHVRQGLAKLPEEQQEVLTLAYFLGYSQREIARLLNQPLGTVKTRTRLALKRLREALRPSPPKEGAS